MLPNDVQSQPCNSSISIMVNAVSLRIVEIVTCQDTIVGFQSFDVLIPQRVGPTQTLHVTNQDQTVLCSR